MKKFIFSIVLALMLLVPTLAVHDASAHNGWHTEYYDCDYANRYVRVDGYYVMQYGSWGAYHSGPYYYRTVWNGYYC